ncbi:MAG: class II glutamine amidotransferase [Chitinophagales bacterium]
MCRMIAKVSPESTSILNEMLHCPTSLKYLSENGRQPETPWERGEHNDGCGLAFINNGKIEIHKRDRANAWDESYQSIVRDARSTFFIAHNRLASKGLSASLDGAHPFFYQPGKTPYAFSHNGTIHAYHDEAKKAGTSDSKIFLQHIVDEQEKHPQRSMERIVTAVAKEKSYNSICAFLLRPDMLQVWRIYNDSIPEQIETFEAYYTLYLSLREGSAVISSEPLDEGNWQLLPNKTFLTLKPINGSLQINYTALNI